MKYTETRSESLVAAHHGRDQWQKLTLAAEKDGTVTGFKVDLLADLGSYVSLVGGGVPVLGAFMFNAIYKFPAYQFNCQTVLTNKTWTDAYRGAGRPEATYAIERMMDELAVEVGVDPLEIREKNWIKHEEFPFTTVAGLEYDSGNYEAATARAKELFGYDELRAEQKKRRDAGDPVQLGIGVSTFTEMCGLAPSRVLGSLDYGAGGWEHASVRMLATGKVEVITGASAHGQGHETAFSQIVADRLGVAVRGRRGAARRHPDRPQGARHLRLPLAGGRRRGAGPGRRQGDREGQADRGPPAGGLRRRPRVLRRAGSRSGAPTRAWPSARSPRPCSRRTTCPTASSRRWTRTRPTTRSTSPSRTAPTSARWRWTPRPVAVKMRKYVACDDIGNIINPLIVAGQVHGGLVQGIAQALWEEAVYDDSGTLVSGSFVDYLLPTAADTISFDIDHTTSASTTNTLGTKGVGEAGTIASTPAVVNAVVDAVRHFGVNDIQMPCTPERVWKAIQPVARAAADRGRGDAALRRWRGRQPGQPARSTEGAGQ